MMTVEADEHEIRIFSEFGHAAATLMRGTGTPANLVGSGGVIIEPPTIVRWPLAA